MKSVLKILLLFVFLSSGIANAADVAIQLGAGDGFVIQNSNGYSELLRLDESTGNVSRFGALFVHTVGSRNTFVGKEAGDPSAAPYALGNSGFGYRALFSISTGDDNSAFGSRALMSNTSGSDLAAFGGDALRYNTSGIYNSAFGHHALRGNTMGADNSAFGQGALEYNTTGGGNAAFGEKALWQNTGSGNTAVGRDALGFHTSGNHNTAVGAGALSYGGGDRNLALGRLAGANLLFGSDNIYIDNQGTFDDSGQIKIGKFGTHTQTTIAGIHGNTSASGIAVYVNLSGTLGTATSSSRFKQNVRALGTASDVLMQLRPVSFEYRSELVEESEEALPQYGLVAEEVAEVAPHLVVYDDEGRPYSVRYRSLTPMLVNELQKLRARVAELEARLAGADR